jgi:uncharacterized protein (DUF3820 family)
VAHNLKSREQAASLSASQPLPMSPLAPVSSSQVNSQANSSGPYVLTFGKHVGKTLEEVPVDCVEWLKSGEVIKSNLALKEAFGGWEKIPRVYGLSFGKYEGCALAEVSPSYINWLKEFDAPKDHEDLRKAIKEHERANAALQTSSVLSQSSQT